MSSLKMLNLHCPINLRRYCCGIGEIADTNLLLLLATTDAFFYSLPFSHLCHIDVLGSLGNPLFPHEFRLHADIKYSLTFGRSDILISISCSVAFNFLPALLSGFHSLTALILYNPIYLFPDVHNDKYICGSSCSSLTNNSLSAAEVFDIATSVLDMYKPPFSGGWLLLSKLLFVSCHISVLYQHLVECRRI